MISSFDIINLQFAQAEFHDTIKDDNFDKKYSQSLSENQLWNTIITEWTQ